MNATPGPEGGMGMIAPKEEGMEVRLQPTVQKPVGSMRVRILVGFLDDDDALVLSVPSSYVAVAAVKARSPAESLAI